MISQYLFEYQRLVNLRQPEYLDRRARLPLVVGCLLLASAAAWVGHCSLYDCPMFG